MDKTRRGLQLLRSAIANDMFHTSLGQLFTKNPNILEIFVNESCDSQCAEGNIWQPQKNNEISLESLQEILKDPLFVDISHANLTGREPLLRTDFFELCQTLITSFPKLTNLQIITNPNKSNVFIERCVEFARISKESNINYSILISLGDIGEDNDGNRAVADNFASAREVINSLKHNELSISLRCTLTPENCYEADDVLIWCQQNGINNWQFRPAIKRKNCYNENDTQGYQFTTDQLFHLIMFFDKLTRFPGLDLTHRLYYRNLVDQMSSNSPRKSSCVWQSDAIALTMQGQIRLCPCQSEPSDQLEGSNYSAAFEQGITERRRIFQQNCSSCQYDSFGKLTTKEVINHLTEIIKANLRKNDSISTNSLNSSVSIKPAKHSSPKDWQRVLITGWYGTETTGDKAILGELVHFIKERSPHCEIVVTSINNAISEQTNLELKDLANSNLIHIKDSHHPRIIESVDAVIMGGGPLMQTNAMESIWRIFREANRQGKARIIFGCGIGPLHTDYLRQLTKQILRYSTAGFFRDEESYEYSKRLAPDNSFGLACDPSLHFVKRWMATNENSFSPSSEELRIATLLRSNTNEFIIGQAKKELADLNVQTANKLSSTLENICTSQNGKAILLAMNAPWIGGDDRLFNRLVARGFNDQNLVQIYKQYLPINILLKELSLSDIAVPMRYHGNLFCLALGIPFLAVDYSGKSGKVQNLIKRIKYEQWSENWADFDIKRATDRMNALIDERTSWSEYLLKQSDNLVNDLLSTYNQIFDSSSAHSSQERTP